MRLIIITALAAAAILLVAGCGDDEGSGDGTRVTASTTVVRDIAANVAGDRAEVTGILTANADPHEYEPRPSDAEAVADADLIVKSGGDLDAWLDQVIEGSGSDAPVVTLIDAMDTIEAEEEGEIEADPHWWQDPRNAVIAVGEIRDALVEVDPDGADDYEANAADYTATIEDVDRQVADCIDRVPEAERKLVTSHDALSYYAQRYGIEVIGATIPGLTTQAQASAGETAELIDLIQSEGVNAIFSEAGVSESLEAAIADETGAEVGGELWADALGPEGSSGATYLEALAANTETLVDGFTGGRVDCRIALD